MAVGVVFVVSSDPFSAETLLEAYNCLTTSGFRGPSKRFALLRHPKHTPVKKVGKDMI